MRLILHSRSFYVAGAAILIGIALFLLLRTIGHNDQDLITTAVERGDVAELVSVSGVVDAVNAADLSFPVTGIVTDVFVDEGDTVSRGEALATLASAQLAAERNSAVATLVEAQANRDELIAGPTSEARSVTNQTVANAAANLAQVIAEQNEKVESARRALFSTDLVARTEDPYEDAEAPTVSGTYTCDTEGTYTIDVYSSASKTGYSYRVSGLESGTYTAFVDSPGAFGNCGLYLQFDEDSNYNRSKWTIEVPNTSASSYQTNKNAYDLVLQQRENAIEAAENALALAREEATLSTASPRSEALRRADAAVLQAKASIDAIDAQIADRSIVAPFDGVVTDVDILPGETATAEPAITMIATEGFELTARIPEIDITKITEGQSAYIVFDARRNEVLEGAVDFISPLALEIDGVAYFEATIGLSDVPPWLRSGLNADIEIVVEEKEGVLRVPTRFVDTSGEESTVLVHDGEDILPKTIELGFEGNDGYVEVVGLAEGTELVAP